MKKVRYPELSAWKALITGCICLGFAQQLIAQPILKEDNYWTVGSSYELHFFDATGVDLSTSGADQVWDLSAIPTVNESYRVEIMDAQNHPEVANFFGATHVTRNNHFGRRGMGAVDRNYHFYQWENGTLYKLGRVDTVAGSLIWLNPFNDKEEFLTYPISYGDVQDEDFFMGGFTSLGLPVNWDDGFSKYSVDAYGQLKLGSTTYDHTLRIKRERGYNSVSSFAGTQSWTFETFEWYVPGTSIPVLTVHHASVNGNDAFEGYYMDASSVRELPTGLKDLNSQSESSLQVFPNPLGNDQILTLQLFEASLEGSHLVVRDLQGKVVPVTVLEKNENEGSIRLGTAQLAPGVYTIHLYGRKGALHQSFIKQ